MPLKGFDQRQKAKKTSHLAESADCLFESRANFPKKPLAKSHLRLAHYTALLGLENPLGHEKAGQVYDLYLALVEAAAPDNELIA